MAKFTIRTVLIVTAAVALFFAVFTRFGWIDVVTSVLYGWFGYGAWVFYREFAAMED